MEDRSCFNLYSAYRVVVHSWIWTSLLRRRLRQEREKEGEEDIFFLPSFLFLALSNSNSSLSFLSSPFASPALIHPVSCAYMKEVGEGVVE